MNHSQAATAVARPAARWGVASVLLAVVITGFFDRISISVLFTDKGFQDTMGTGFNPPVLGLLMTSFLFAYGASGLLLGFLGDRLGPRRGLLLGGTLWGALMLFMGTVSSFGVMLAARVGLGIAEGPQFSFTNKVIKRWFPAQEQGRANAIWLAGSPLGSAIGFPLTVAVLAAGSWRTSFYVMAGLNLLLMVPLVFAVIRDFPPGTPLAQKAAERVTGRFGADVKLFLRDWRFWMIVISNTCALVYLWGLNSWLPSYLMRARHFDLRGLGIFASLPFVLMFAGELLGGFVSDRLGRRALIILAGLLGAGFFVYLTPMASNAYVAAVLIAVSAGFWGMALPPIFALSGQILPPQVTATGVGVFNGIGNLVGACSPLLMGWIIGTAESFDAGLMVLVVAGGIGACAMVPLLPKY